VASAPLASLDARAGALYARVHGAVLQLLAGRRLALGRQREVLLRLRLTSRRGAPGESIARLATQVARRRHAAATRLAVLEGRLEALDPLAVLKRGYAMAVASDGKVVTDTARLAVGDSLRLRFARGAADVRVQALPTGDSTDEGNGLPGPTRPGG
jgi:exodeoxyribonuclease VII large subunit